MTLLANHATHPRTFAYQHARPECLVHGWLPDAVTDTSRKRQRLAQKLLNDGLGLLPRLWGLPGHQLWHVVVPLPEVTDFYANARSAGQAALRQLFPTAPALAQVAYGRSGLIHVHALVALPQGQAPSTSSPARRLFAGQVTTAQHLSNLARYFSRPADERAARPNRLARLRYTPEVLQQQRLDAAEMYLDARAQLGMKSLSRRRWAQHVRQISAEPEPQTWTGWGQATLKKPVSTGTPSFGRPQKEGPRRALLGPPSSTQTLPQARGPPKHGGERFRPFCARHLTIRSPTVLHPMHSRQI